jgi:hypothetical protein
LDRASTRCYHAPVSFPRIFLLVLCGCVARPADGGPAFRERLLATISEDARVVIPVAFSVDGQNAAWVERRGDASRAVCGAWKGKPYGVVC